MDNVSIVDVAKRAGVSITTVSRIINNVAYPVSATAREKVLKAIEELNYSPNKAAQRLKKSSSDILGLIVRDITDSYFGEITKGVTERANQLGYLSFICNTGRNPLNELSYHELLWQHRVKGIILTGGGLDQSDYKQKLAKQLARHQKYGLKIVSLAPQGMDVPYVMINNFEAGKSITEYLVVKGHRKIGFISGPKKVFTSMERLKGYQYVLSSNNIVYDEAYITHSDFSQTSGYEACIELLSKVTGLTAICFANDNIAVGAMSAIKEKGYRIPEDISVISIGDTPEAKYADPPLTTLAVPRYKMGEMAVDFIVEERKNVNITLDTHIIERKSIKNLG
ncbi:MAG TPA: LacI family DNA-binding transcriptional regulator [Bacillota bacterium]|nr:LacI family DNA-binding transcriptional regulator [Bacillota bacterium]